MFQPAAAPVFVLATFSTVRCTSFAGWKLISQLNARIIKSADSSPSITRLLDILHDVRLLSSNLLPSGSSTIFTICVICGAPQAQL